MASSLDDTLMTEYREVARAYSVWLSLGMLDLVRVILILSKAAFMKG